MSSIESADSPKPDRQELPLRSKEYQDTADFIVGELTTLVAETCDARRRGERRGDWVVSDGLLADPGPEEMRMIQSSRGHIITVRPLEDSHFDRVSYYKSEELGGSRAASSIEVGWRGEIRDVDCVLGSDEYRVPSPQSTEDNPDTLLALRIKITDATATPPSQAS